MARQVTIHLIGSDREGRLTGANAFLPLHGELDGLGDAERRTPAQLRARLGRVDHQEPRLVRAAVVFVDPTGIGTPQPGGRVGQAADRELVFRRRAEVPRRVVPRLVQVLREREVAAERLEDVLPRTGRSRPAQSGRVLPSTLSSL